MSRDDLMTYIKEICRNLEVQIKSDKEMSKTLLYEGEVDRGGSYAGCAIGMKFALALLNPLVEKHNDQ